MASFLAGPGGARLAYVRTPPRAPAPGPPSSGAMAAQPGSAGIVFCPGLLSNMNGCVYPCWLPQRAPRRARGAPQLQRVT